MDINERNKNPCNGFSDEAKKEMLDEVLKDPNKIADYKVGNYYANELDNTLQNDEEIKKEAESSSKNTILNKLNGIQAKSEKEKYISQDERNQAEFEKNKANYLNFGIDHKVDKEWQKKIIEIGNDIWFVIYAIFSFFFIIPFSILISRFTVLGSKFLKFCFIAGMVFCTGGVISAILLPILKIVGVL